MRKHLKPEALLEVRGAEQPVPLDLTSGLTYHSSNYRLCVTGAPRMRVQPQTHTGEERDDARSHQ